MSGKYKNPESLMPRADVPALYQQKKSKWTRLTNPLGLRCSPWPQPAQKVSESMPMPPESPSSAPTLSLPGARRNSMAETQNALELIRILRAATYSNTTYTDPSLKQMGTSSQTATLYTFSSASRAAGMSDIPKESDKLDSNSSAKPE